MIGDTDFKVSKLYDMLPAATSGDVTKRTAADNQTVRNVFVIGPDKKIKLVLVYPMTHRAQFPGNPARHRFTADDREAPRRDAGRLETGRRRHHLRLGERRRGQDDLSAGLEIAETLYPDRAAAEVTCSFHHSGHRDAKGPDCVGFRVRCVRIFPGMMSCDRQIFGASQLAIISPRSTTPP